MIPTLILFGMVSGRWWHLSLVAAAVGCPRLLVATDAMMSRLGYSERPAWL